MKKESTIKCLNSVALLYNVRGGRKLRAIMQINLGRSAMICMREQAAIMLQCAWRQKLARNKFHELRQERLELDRKREEEERSAAELAAQKAAEEAERLRLEEEERNRRLTNNVRPA